MRFARFSSLSFSALLFSTVVLAHAHRSLRLATAGFHTHRHYHTLSHTLSATTQTPTMVHHKEQQPPHGGGRLPRLPRRTTRPAAQKPTQTQPVFWKHAPRGSRLHGSLCSHPTGHNPPRGSQRQRRPAVRGAGTMPCLPFPNAAHRGGGEGRKTASAVRADRSRAGGTARQRFSCSPRRSTRRRSSAVDGDMSGQTHEQIDIAETRAARARERVRARARAKARAGGAVRKTPQQDRQHDRQSRQAVDKGEAVEVGLHQLQKAEEEVRRDQAHMYGLSQQKHHL